MKAELQAVLETARSLPADALPQFLGELETVRAVAWSRLTSPAPPVPNGADELLDIDAAAARLGISSSYLYRHHSQFPFSRRVGRTLRFSAFGIQSYISCSGALTPGRRRPTLIPLAEANRK